MDLFFFSQKSFKPGIWKNIFGPLSAFLACLVIVCIFTEDLADARRGFGGGFRGNRYGGFRKPPTFRQPAYRGNPGLRRAPSGPRVMNPRQPIPNRSGLQRSLPKTIHKQAPVTSLKGFTGKVTKKGSPIVQAKGKNYQIPQRGISSSLRGKLLSGASKTALKPGTKARLNKMSSKEWKQESVKQEIEKKLQIGKDDFSIRGTIKGDSNAWVRAEVKGEAVNVTDIHRGGLPRRSGGMLLAKTLQAHKVSPKQLTISNITHEKTLKAHARGLHPSKSTLGRTAQNALKEMGLEAKSMKWVEIKGKPAIQVDIQ